MFISIVACGRISFLLIAESSSIIHSCHIFSPTHPSLDIWVASTFSYFHHAIMKWLCNNILIRHVYWLFWRIYSELGLLDHILILFLIFWGSFIIFFHKNCTNLHFYQESASSNFSKFSLTFISVVTLMGERDIFKNKIQGPPWGYSGKEPALQNWECGFDPWPRSWDLAAWATKPMYHIWTACMGFSYSACVPQKRSSPLKADCFLSYSLQISMFFGLYSHYAHLNDWNSFLLLRNLQNKFCYPTSLTQNPVFCPPCYFTVSPMSMCHT